MFEVLAGDVQAARERDPAARSVLEIVLCYSGLHATLAHRFHHWLWTRGMRLWARSGSQVAKWLTGIEIHPGAQIGANFFIDHGAGTVIGETAVIGDNCTLFHGVTLGGTGKETGKRHPTLEDDVTIGAHAQIIGSITIGKGTVVGAGAMVLDSIPDYCTVVGPKAYVVRRQGKRVYDFRHDKQPRMTDPAIECMLLRIRKLEAELTQTGSVSAQEAHLSQDATVEAQPEDTTETITLRQGALVDRWLNRKDSDW